MTDALPWLTKRRWGCLQAFKRQRILMERCFMAKEMILPNRKGEWVFPATGATMDSLRDAGWVRRVYFGDDQSLGFRLGRMPPLWEITDAGREAVKNCPDTFPGEPVYRKEADK
jgi:hypothetical protein